MGGIDGLAAAMMFGLIFVTPLGMAGAVRAFSDPIAIAAGIGVGVSSSVIPYVFDQLAMARLPRSTYALFVALLPATATVIGVIVLRQLPSAGDLIGVALVMVGVVLHKPEAPGLATRDQPDNEVRAALAVSSATVAASSAADASSAATRASSANRSA